MVIKTYCFSKQCKRFPKCYRGLRRKVMRELAQANSIINIRYVDPATCAIACALDKGAPLKNVSIIRPIL